MIIKEAQRLIHSEGYRTEVTDNETRLVVRTRADEYVMAFVIVRGNVDTYNVNRFLGFA